MSDIGEHVLVDWPIAVYEKLTSLEVLQVSFVPDAGLTQLINLCNADSAIETIPLTSEEEGIALSAGAWLGGVRSAVLMQSSGVGNIVNMLSLSRTCGFPLFILVTMRGESGEVNEWQVPMGRGTSTILEVSGVNVRRAEKEDQVAGLVGEAAHTAFTCGKREAVLISQSIIGVKSFDK